MERLKKLIFRFFFVYFFLTIAPWTWPAVLPWFKFINEIHSKAMQLIVFRFNDWFLHIKDTLNTEGFGSGDTSYGWAEFYTIIILAFGTSIVWSFFEKKEKNSRILAYWLHNLVRYNLIFVAFSYGIIKLFALQMPAPNLSQLATPLGDFLPMRFCWIFIGYSQPYEVFSGVMEVAIGLLLLYRRTIPLGLIVGLGVFINVFVLNLSYDIPVKLYSMQIVICCLFLLAIDYKQYLNFFIFNKPTIPTSGYAFRFTKRWKRIGRVVLKSAFLLLVLGWNLYDCYNWYNEANSIEKPIIPQGIYHIKAFKKNHQLTAIDANDSLAWKDFIFDKQKLGSIKTCDTLLRKRYSRGYFVYEADPKKQTISFKKSFSDSIDLFVMNYKITGKKLELEGKLGNDTLYYELEKSGKAFPLAKRHFHWISEANR
ncbi:MAG: hypothetical protein QM710_00405 [Flavobacterium sp.]